MKAENKLGDRNMLLTYVSCVMRVAYVYCFDPSSCDDDMKKLLNQVETASKRFLLKRMNIYATNQKKKIADEIEQIYRRVRNGEIDTNEEKELIRKTLGKAAEVDTEIVDVLTLSAEDIVSLGGPVQAAAENYGKFGGFSARTSFKMKKKPKGSMPEFQADPIKVVSPYLLGLLSNGSIEYVGSKELLGAIEKGLSYFSELNSMLQAERKPIDDSLLWSVLEKMEILKDADRRRQKRSRSRSQFTGPLPADT